MMRVFNSLSCLWVEVVLLVAWSDYLTRMRLVAQFSQWYKDWKVATLAKDLRIHARANQHIHTHTFVLHRDQSMASTPSRRKQTYTHSMLWWRSFAILKNNMKIPQCRTLTRKTTNINFNEQHSNCLWLCRHSCAVTCTLKIEMYARAMFVADKASVIDEKSISFWNMSHHNTDRPQTKWNGR